MKSLVSIILLVVLSSPIQAKNYPYIAAGMSASDREWIARDYQAFVETLQAEKVALPTLNDAASAKYFERLINTDNFSFSKNKTLLIDNRIQNILSVGQFTNEVTKIYLRTYKDNPELHSELANLQGFGLRMAEVVVELIKEFLPTIPKDDSYDVRIQGLNQMCSAMIQILAGAETSLSEQDTYSKDDLTIIINAMYETMPTLAWCSTPEHLAELAVRLENRAKELKKLNIDVGKIEEIIGRLKA